MRLMVVGHSLGGLDAMITSIEEPDVTCTVALDPADGTADSARLFEQSPSGATKIGRLGGYTMHALGREMREGQPRLDVGARMEELRSPLLIVSPDQSNPESGARLAKAARAAGVSPFDHLVLAGDHHFNWSRIELSRVVVDWMTGHCM